MCKLISPLDGRCRSRLATQPSFAGVRCATIASFMSRSARRCTLAMMLARIAVGYWALQRVCFRVSHCSMLRAVLIYTRIGVAILNANLWCHRDINMSNVYTIVGPDGGTRIGDLEYAMCKTDTSRTHAIRTVRERSKAVKLC